MNEPIYQAWRTITPVEGEPIPKGAEYRLVVPVMVIPEDVAVDAIMQNAFEVNSDNSWIVEIDGQREYRADTKDQLRELVLAKLRGMSQEKTNGTGANEAVDSQPTT